MKKFTVFTKVSELEKAHPKLFFALRTAWFYLMLMILFFYFMLANLSSAPKYVYTAF